MAQVIFSAIAGFAFAKLQFRGRQFSILFVVATMMLPSQLGIVPLFIMAHGKDEVFVGRIRRDESQKNTLNVWIVADNLRKGAATNAVQIAEYLAANNLI